MVDLSKLQPTWLWNLGKEGPLPSTERQIKRMFCLTAMTVLSSTVEGILDDDPDVEQAWEQLDQTVAWIRANADDELTEEERECVEAKPEAWTQRQLIDGSWRFQAAAVIGWALGLADWLPMWESYGPEHFEFVFIESSVEEVQVLVKPRPIREVELKNSVACAWLWRCRDSRKDLPTGFTERRRFLQQLARFADECFKSGEFLPPIEGDLNVKGKPFGKLTQAERNEIGSRSDERLRALNWLHGQDPDYRFISCDT